MKKNYHPVTLYRCGHCWGGQGRYAKEPYMSFRVHPDKLTPLVGYEVIYNDLFFYLTKYTILLN